MTDEKNIASSGESGMIKEDPAFDPAWDLKAAQQVAKESVSGKKEGVKVEAEDKGASVESGQADESESTAVTGQSPQGQGQPVQGKAEVEGFESAEEVPEFIKEQKTGKQDSSQAPGQVDGGLKEALSVSPDNTQGSLGAVLPPVPKPKAVSGAGRVKKKHRIIWGDVISCWILGIGFLAVLGILLIFFLAKSGVVNVPFLSHWLYEAPIPNRYVTGQPMNWEEFQQLATERLMEQDLQKEPPITLNMSESEFTGLLHGVVRQGLRSSEYQAEVAQVVFLEDAIELYFYLTWKDFFSFEILTHLVPIVEDDGTLKFEVADAKFGDLPLPGDWVIGIIGYFFERDIGAWRIVLSNGYGIQDTDLDPPTINLLIGPVLSE